MSPSIKGNRPRVLFLSRFAYPEPQGAGGVVSGRAIAKAVAEQGWDVRFVALREGLTSITTEKDGPLTIIRYPYKKWKQFPRLSNLWGTFLQLRDVLRYELRTWRPDVVHLLNFDALVYGSEECRRRGIPSVSTINTPSAWCATQDGIHRNGHPCTACTSPLRDCLAHWGFLRGIAYYCYTTWLLHRMRRAYRFVDHLFPISDGILRGLSSMGVPANKMTIIHNPVDLEDVRPGRTMLPTPRGAFTLLYAGRVAPDKNCRQVIRALPTTDKSVHFIILGDGEDVQFLRSLASSLGVAERVHFIGRVAHSDVASYVASADVVVVPSLMFEPLSRTVIEAMAIGKPCIVSDRGGNPESVADGERGFVVPPFDVPMMTKRIETLRRSPALRRMMGAAAQQWVRDSLSPARQGMMMTAVYDMLRP